jgi:hypothetical protein
MYKINSHDRSKLKGYNLTQLPVFFEWKPPHKLPILTQFSVNPNQLRKTKYLL